MVLKKGGDAQTSLYKQQEVKITKRSRIRKHETILEDDAGDNSYAINFNTKLWLTSASAELAS